MQSLVPWKDFQRSLNSESHKKSLQVFLWQEVMIFCLFVWTKKCLCYPRLGDEGSILAYIIVSASMASLPSQKMRETFSQYSYITNGQLVSSSAYFPWNMTSKYKIRLPEGSWDKILHSKLRALCCWKEENFFSGGLSFEVIDPSSGSSFCDFFVKTTKES